LEVILHLISVKNYNFNAANLSISSTMIFADLLSLVCSLKHWSRYLWTLNVTPLSKLTFSILQIFILLPIYLDKFDRMIKRLYNMADFTV